MRQQFLWVIFPYLSLSVFVLGHLYRHAFRQYGWTTRSSEFLEKRQLRWASLLFHWGIVFVFLGHVAGLLVPQTLTAALGLSAALYHRQALVLGGLAGTATIAGIAWLNWRRWTISRLRATSQFWDYAAIGLLGAVIGLGLYNTLGQYAAAYDYRTTVAPWLRGLLLLRPDASLMAGVPLSFQLHILAAFLLFALWPFTRLVHVWSLPVPYLRRRYILYRRRSPVRRDVAPASGPGRPQTGGN